MNGLRCSRSQLDRCPKKLEGHKVHTALVNFRSLAGVPGIDWLFMIGLLGIGLALILGVAIRPAALSGSLMLLMMWAAVWVPAKIASGQPSGSTNPLVDDHIGSIFGLIVLAGLATWGPGTSGGSGPRSGWSRQCPG
jgi:thiosulfate dehydrogenase (quinone) large subunit